MIDGPRVLVTHTGNVVYKMKAELNTMQSNTLISNSADCYWIGLKHNFTERVWRWEYDGSAVTYNDWKVGEPDNLDVAICAAIHANRGGPYGWIDLKCRGNKDCAMFCEK